MTPKQKREHVAKLKGNLIADEWKEDRWGHFKKTIAGKLHRMKFKKNVLRHEVKYGSRWVRVQGDFYACIDAK